MPERLRLGLVFGGSSVEHEVSVVSAQHVMAAADPERFDVVPIGVSTEGAWLTPEATAAALAQPDVAFKKRLTGGRPGLADAVAALATVDVVFPLIHGRHGEDGTLQGLLELAGLPYVGCGVGASAIGMDKALMKTAFRGAGLPLAEHVVLQADEAGSVDAMREIEARLGYPTFVKPANGGSSLGVSRVRGREELSLAIAEAARYDRKLVIEKQVEGREVECAVLGNEDAQASPVGEIKHQRDFYDYEAKYLDASTQIVAPADLPAEAVSRIQALALQAFHALDGAGLSRVDFFYCPDGSVVLAEINTIPGFTPASMFPLLWQCAGISYSELITRLVALALARQGRT